jgi:hypothetical protein
MASRGGSPPVTGGAGAIGAVALKTFVPRLEMLSEAERALRTEWLDGATGSERSRVASRARRHAALQARQLGLAQEQGTPVGSRRSKLG